MGLKHYRLVSNALSGYFANIVASSSDCDTKDYVDKGSVFSSFADIDYFKQLRVNRELGALCWPGDVDIAPEILYHEATEEPLSVWMDTKEGLKAV